MRPGAGAKFLLASSALMRHSIAWPRSSMSSCVIDRGSPGRHPDAFFDDVDPGDEFGHGVLDLDARVHLEEEVLGFTAALVSHEQTLDRAGPGVVDGGGRLGRDLADASAQLIAHRRRRSLLDQLLVASLQRAVALSQVDHVAVRCRRAPGPPRVAGRAGSARGRRWHPRRTSRPRERLPRRRRRVRLQTAPRESPCLRLRLRP